MARGSSRSAVISFRTTPAFQHLLRAAAAEEGVPVAHLVERVVREEVAVLALRAAGEAGRSAAERLS